MGWLLVSPIKIMIDKKIYKRYRRLLDILKKEDDKLKEQRTLNIKDRDKYILRSLEDKEDRWQYDDTRGKTEECEIISCILKRKI